MILSCVQKLKGQYLEAIEGVWVVESGPARSLLCCMYLLEEGGVSSRLWKVRSCGTWFGM